MLKSIQRFVFSQIKANKRVSTNKKFTKILNIRRNPISLFSVMSANSVKTSDERNTNQQKTILKSKNDKLIYKYIVLENGLKAFLVSDPSYKCTKEGKDANRSETSDSEISSSEDDLTDVSSVGSDTGSEGKTSRHKPKRKSSCNEKLSAMAVVVRSGSFCDPKEVQGLAHLVEHVITMGSEKFPEENGLDDYLTSRGGYQNAHTEYEYTLYEIEIQKKHFYGALQRLAHYFIHPLLKADSIERETKPVDTEFLEAMNEDEVRFEQILHNLANKEHPFCSFPWGNAVSLKQIPEKNGTDTQKCVKEFVSKHYYSDNIHVVIQSQETIEVLEKWVTELFTQIKPSEQNSIPEDHKFGNPFKDNPNFNKLYLIEPVHEVDQLSIIWCLPSVVKHYTKCPLDYLGHIIGHEGKGSLISVLRKENLALELSGGLEESGFANNRYSSMFVIQIKLTDLGHKKIDSVVEYVFEYLKVLQSMGSQEWFFNEFRNIEENHFNWREEHTAIDLVKKIAYNMNTLPIEYVLRGNKLYTHFDKQMIENYLNYLVPTNACFVRLSSNILKGSEAKDIKTEKWFGTKYKMIEVPQNWLSVQSRLPDKSSHFHFPEPNRFIATDFTIKEFNEKNCSLYPRKVLDKNRLKVWHKFDQKFKLPKAIIKLHLISPHIYKSVETIVMTDLFVEMLNHKLSEETYAATLAGLSWHVNASTSGLIINISGFNDKLNVLLETIISKMIGFEVEDNEFNDIKKNLSKEYHNAFIDPKTLCRSLRLTVLGNRFVNSLNRRAVIQNVDQNKLKDYLKALFSDFYIEALIQGNLTKEESIDLMTKTEQKFGLNSQSGNLEEPKLITTEIPIGEHFCRVMSLSATNKNSSITNYYQLFPADIHLQCLVGLLSDIMGEPCFNNLRTKEGLGYHVAPHDYDTNGISGYGVSVTSSGNEFDCTFVESRIENFLKLMIEHILNMKDETFKNHITSIITHKKAPDLELKDEFTRNWNEIITFSYCFDRVMKEIKCLEKITFDEFKEWSCNQVLKDQHKKRKLSIQIVGNGKKSLAECLTIDGNQLKTEEQLNEEKANEVEVSEHSLKKFKLTYLKSKNIDNNRNNFIEDIYEYKKILKLYPFHKVID